ncbi:MAG: cytochrome P450 [Steroidobacteraceae bacterium]
MTDPAAQIDFSRAKQLGNQLLVQLDSLREAAPIAWSAKQNAWIVTGHAEVIEAFRGELPLSANRLPRIFSFMPDPAERERRIPYVMQTFSRMLLNLDPPEQSRLRQLLMKAFNRHVAEHYRPYAREVIADALNDLAAQGGGDFVEIVARRIPSRVIVRLMGLTDDYIPRMRHWAWATLSGAGGGGTTPAILDETEKAFHEMRAAFMAEIEKRRGVAGNDFISSLLSAEVNGEKLTDEEIVASCIMSLIAGHDTTGNTIGLGTLTLARSPALWSELRNVSPEERLNAIMEIQRVAGMSTTQGRVVAADFDWRGHHFEKGQIVYLMVASANRDPKVFADPLHADFQRPQQNNATFGPGLHHCIGHLLAKMQLTEYFPALVERFDGLEILDEELDWGTMLGFRGLQSLNVRVVPRAAQTN